MGKTKSIECTRYEIQNWLVSSSIKSPVRSEKIWTICKNEMTASQENFSLFELDSQIDEAQVISRVERENGNSHCEMANSKVLRGRKNISHGVSEIMPVRTSKFCQLLPFLISTIMELIPNPHTFKKTEVCESKSDEQTKYSVIKDKMKHMVNANFDSIRLSKIHFGVGKGCSHLRLNHQRVYL